MKQFLRISKNNKITGFQAFMERRNYKPETISGYSDYIMRFNQWLLSEQIPTQQCSHADIMSFAQLLQQNGQGINYINKYMTSIRHLFNYLIYAGKVKENPARNIVIHGGKKNVLRDTIEPEVLRKLYGVAPDGNNVQKRNKAMLGLICFQGITTAELTRLRPGDINLLSCSVSIPSVNRSKPRSLLLEAVQVKLLIEYTEQVRPDMLGVRKKPSDKLFFSCEKSKNPYSMIVHFLKYTRGIDPSIKSFLQIRASVISHWLTKSDILTVQKQAGHRSPSSTEKYEVQNRKDLKQKLDKLFALNFQVN